MKFSVCLTWQKSDKQIAHEKDFHRTEYYQQEMDIFESCGIPNSLVLNAYVKPRLIKGDIDGNGEIDTAAPVIRKDDGKKGVAICRNGNQIDLLGMDNDIPPSLDKGYFDMMESWSIVGRKEIEDKYEDVVADKLADVIAVERIEKSKYLIYRTDSGYQSYRMYRYIEP